MILFDHCYEVAEHMHDPGVLPQFVEKRFRSLGIPFEKTEFTPAMRPEFDFVVWATYGLGPSPRAFKIAKFQVAEKMLIELPPALQHIALVVVDGPFTAFDPFGSSARSLFGSAKNTNHWTSTDPGEPVSEPYAGTLNEPEFRPAPFTRFEAMRQDCCESARGARNAKHIGSRFTIRVVEDNPEQDRRILYLLEGAPGEIHILSGKVVSAVKAARLVCERIAGHG